jgi:hypothetical protein
LITDSAEISGFSKLSCCDQFRLWQRNFPALPVRSAALGKTKFKKQFVPVHSIKNTLFNGCAAPIEELSSPQ